MWIKFFINRNEIEYDTGKAMLIKIPRSSKKIWIPSVFIKESGNRLEVGIPDTFKGKIGSKTANAEDISDLFSEISGNSGDDRESYLVVKEPEKIERKVEIPDELKND